MVSDAAVSPEVDPPAPAHPAAPPASVWALFVGLGLLMIGNGLNGALIGVRATAEGFGATATGIVVAGYFAGFLLAPNVVLRAISSVGHIRVFAGLASTASSAVLVHAVSVVPITWVSMRFVFGFCMSGLYLVIESWLGARSDAATRGRTLAIYMVVSMGGLAVGQYLIALADTNGFRLFVLSSVLVSMSLVPMTFAGRVRAPDIDQPGRVSLKELTATVPTGVVGSFMAGAATGIVIGLAVVFAAREGLSIQRTALFALAPTIGGVVMPFPIGKLSDLVRRRVVIFGVSMSGVVLAVLGAVTDPTSVTAIVLMFGIGGCVFPLYSLVIGYSLDWMRVDQTVGTSATLIRVNGSGALVGPLVSAPAMAELGSAWFFWLVSGAFAVVVGFILYRIVFREALPEEREGEYLPVPARASQLAVSAIARPVRSVASAAGRAAHRPRRHH